MFGTSRARRSGATRVATAAAVAVLVAAGCTPPPPPAGDVVLLASQTPAGDVHYVDQPVADEQGSGVIISQFELTVQIPNFAHGPFGNDFWQVECNGPMSWSGGARSCPADGNHVQIRGAASHVYETEGTVTVIPGDGVNDATFVGTTSYAQSFVLPSGPIFQDPTRAGRVHAELLEVRDGDQARMLARADEDAVLNESRASQYNVGLYSGRPMFPLDQAGPGIHLGEVEVGATELNAATHVPTRTGSHNSFVYEIDCDAPPSVHPDGWASCPASGRYAYRVLQQNPSFPSYTRHHTLVGTLTTQTGAVPAVGMFEGTRTYSHSVDGDGTVYDEPGQAYVGPRFLQVQDGRPTGAPYPFPD